MGLIIQHFRRLAVPVSVKCIVRDGTSTNAAFCIATFHTADDAQNF